MLDGLDAQILHSLQLAPRISLRRIAAVLGVPDQMVARRYHRLRRNGVLRVVGLQNRWAPGAPSWVCRVRTAPERMQHLADVMAQRPEVSHANVLAGWSELVCIIQAPLGDDREDVLPRLLSHTPSVTDVTVDLLLHVYGRPASAPWTSYGQALTDDQVDRVLADRADPAPAEHPPPAAEDRVIFGALAEDGRTPHSTLAARTGWSVARVGRRLTALQACGALQFDVDVLPERLGHRISAMLWLTVSPTDVEHVGEQIAAHRRIAFSGALSGTTNLMAVAICTDGEDLYEYLSQELGRIPQIHGYAVSLRTHRLKQHGSLIAHGRLVPPRSTADRR